MGSIGKDSGLIAKINAMGEENEVDNLLKMSPTEILRNGGREALRNLRAQNVPIQYHNEEVNINQLETEQATVFKDTLIPIANNLKGEISGWEAISNATSKTDSGIRVVRYKGHMTVVDGNNRVNVAILNGQRKIKVRVIDIN